MGLRILLLEIRTEHDVVLVRQRSRQIAALLGFEAQDQSRIATAVSEIARNAFEYAGGGRAEFRVEGQAPQQALQIGIHDRGPGIADVQRILDGAYTSRTGMGLGITGARRLMDRLHIESSAENGTSVVLEKVLPRRAPAVTPERVGKLAEELFRRPPQGPLDELHQQNQELLRAMEELRARQNELQQLNRELEDTNRGVVALYAELEEKAESLQRISEVKTRFLSNMTHEFRTPLNSILGLSRILLDRLDGDLTAEQEKQVTFVRKAAEDLSELVNDLLDLAKVEAGKTNVRPAEFRVADVFGALRGMLRPLLQGNNSVNLVFEADESLPSLRTDEGKVSQILRNFISNALKYTERGEVRVMAQQGPGDTMIFSVADTGIGIAPEDQERIFEEYTQVDSPLQRRVKGTGLGLPLSRRLAELLGGRLLLQSQLGSGSTFQLLIPRLFGGSAAATDAQQGDHRTDPLRLPILVVEDNRQVAFLYETYLRSSAFQVVQARTSKAARQALREIRPVAIILDILLQGESTWDLLQELKSSEATKQIPVIVATLVDNERKALALGADAFSIKPVEPQWLVQTISRLLGPKMQQRVLIIDDDEISRYLLKGLLVETKYGILEASAGREGLESARQDRPSAIFLDLYLKDMSGFEALVALKEDPATRDIPVIVNTARHLEEADRARLNPMVVDILSKNVATRDAALVRLRSALERAGLGGERRSEESAHV